MLLRPSESRPCTARAWLHAGKIVAVKGLGGYLLACDAANPAAVAELRRRKNRTAKAFALMSYDLTVIQRYCQLSAAEGELLQQPAAPIVLLQKLPGAALAPALAPGSTPWALCCQHPLHLLLLEPGPGMPEVLVMTSGNLSEEPIAYTDTDAFERLGEIADAFLTHDRPIHMRVDDSVVKVMAKRPYLLRRARGYAPNPLRLFFVNCPPCWLPALSYRTAFCLTRERYAFLSHHIGDLENYETLQSFEEGIQHYQRLFRVQPQLLACDLHPDYLSTRCAHQRAAAENLPGRNPAPPRASGSLPGR